MKFGTYAMAFAFPLAFALPAQAHYVRVDYQGSILAALPDALPDFAVGTPIYFSVRFDTAKLVDRTQSLNDATGLGFISAFTASLSDDPKASLSIRIGSTSFDKFDQENYGTPRGDGGPGDNLGVGNFPVATYLNGHFAGVGNIFVNAAGYSLDADPIADALGAFGGYDFFFGRSVGGNPFAVTLAVGNFDAVHATTTDVPEPATWSLMIAGFGAVGTTLRRRQQLAVST